MRVQVTQDDIDRGEASHCTRCPVALAVCRAAGTDHMVSVDEEMILINGQFYNAPESVYEFVTAFDHKQPVQPFEFDLEVA